MVGVAVAPQLNDKIEHALKVAIWAWSSIPYLAQQWQQWEPEQREVERLEWSKHLARDREIQDWSEEFLFTESQCEAYQSLLQLHKQHRPTLVRLLGRKLSRAYGLTKQRNHQLAGDAA